MEHYLEFLKEIFPNLQDGYIEMRAIHSKTGAVKFCFYSSIDDVTSNQESIKSLAKEHHVYFGVCPRQEEVGNKSSVKFVCFLWADLDAKDFPGGKTEAMERIRAFPIPPTIVVDSGNGFHVYWRLKEPFEIKSPEDIVRIEAYLKALARAIGADLAAAEIARILRLPGTLNHKDVQFPKRVNILEHHSDQQCNLGDFDSILSIPSLPDLKKSNPPGWIAEAFSSMSEENHNRNTTFTKIIGRLHYDRWAPQDIYEILEPRALKHNYKLDELQRQIDGICARYQNQKVNSHISLNSQQHSEKKWPEPPKKEAYYGLVGEIVRAIEPHTEADPVALLVQALVLFGNIIGKTAYFSAEADKHFMNMFSVLVGTTAKGRKGTSFGQIKRLFESVELFWAKNRIQSGLSSGEGLIWAVRDPIERQDPVKEKGKVISYETVIADQGVSDKRLLVMETEFASTLRVIGRDGNTLSALVRQAWDTGDLRVLTKNSPAKATDAHISIIGHITKEELLRYLDRTETANGFANRFLWGCVKRSKSLPEGGQIQEVDFAPMLKKLEQAVSYARQISEIKRDEYAKALWHKEYERLSREKPGLLGALTARAEPQVMRLACIYALYDCSDEVRIEHLQAALALWDYVEASVAYIFGDNLGDPIADTILASLRSNPDGLSRTDISNLFKRHTESGQISRALGTLKEFGWAEVRSSSTEGRSKEIWVAIAK